MRQFGKTSFGPRCPPASLVIHEIITKSITEIPGAQSKGQLVHSIAFVTWKLNRVESIEGQKGALVVPGILQNLGGWLICTGIGCIACVEQ